MLVSTEYWHQLEAHWSVVNETANRNRPDTADIVDETCEYTQSSCSHSECRLSQFCEQTWGKTRGEPTVRKGNPVPSFGSGDQEVLTAGTSP